MIATMCRQPTTRNQRPNGIRSALRGAAAECFGGVATGSVVGHRPISSSRLVSRKP